jgi:hypothetical protein
LAPVVPEDFELAPGELSTIDRTSPPAPEDAFRCPGCTQAECQVCWGTYVVQRLVKLHSQLAGCKAATQCLASLAAVSAGAHLGLDAQLHLLHFPLHSAACRPEIALYGLVPPVDSCCVLLQTDLGCAQNMWRWTLEGYLREILTARVYDVAVSSNTFATFLQLCQ